MLQRCAAWTKHRLILVHEWTEHNRTQMLCCSLLYYNNMINHGQDLPPQLYEAWAEIWSFYISTCVVASLSSIVPATLYVLPWWLLSTTEISLYIQLNYIAHRPLSCIPLLSWCTFRKTVCSKWISKPVCPVRPFVNSVEVQRFTEVCLRKHIYIGEYLWQYSWLCRCGGSCRCVGKCVHACGYRYASMLCVCHVRVCIYSYGIKLHCWGNVLQ